jgi:hypothetical protein
MKKMIEFFGYESVAAFMADWKKLTPEDQAQLKDGFSNGSMTY